MAGFNRVRNILDVRGIPVQVGDKVAFAMAMQGASGFCHGVVTKFVGGKSVKIEHAPFKKDSYTYISETVRRSGCFAILGDCDE